MGFGSGRKTNNANSTFFVTVCGEAARAYQIAQEIPDILDELYCCCEYDRHLGHHSLHSCIVDSHAATWVDICQGEALDASLMATKGYGIDEIHRYIDGKYSRM